MVKGDRAFGLTIVLTLNNEIEIARASIVGSQPCGVGAGVVARRVYVAIQMRVSAQAQNERSISFPNGTQPEGVSPKREIMPQLLTPRLRRSDL